MVLVTITVSTYLPVSIILSALCVWAHHNPMQLEQLLSLFFPKRLYVSTSKHQGQNLNPGDLAPESHKSSPLSP